MDASVPELFFHPFAAFCWKPLIALYERNVAFEYRQVGPDFPANQSKLERLWPLAQFPVLLHRGRTLVESAVIIEYLDLEFESAAPRMVPADPREALEARMLDSVVDDYIAAPMQRIVADFMRAEAARDAVTVAQAKATLDKAYDWLDARLEGRQWATGGTFGLADCAAGPALFYADWVHPIAERTHLAAYRARLLARPSVKRVVDDARPYRHFFPPGAPDRD